MILIPDGVNIIENYPFRVENLVIDALGKPVNWKEVLKNLHDADTYETLASRVHKLGGKRIVCPKPVHKTDISSSKQLKVLSVSRDQVAIYRGEDADGAAIDSGEVYALASGDCPTVAISDPETQTVVAMHFNRENGIDNNILEKALLRFPKNTHTRMVATISLGIGPNSFEHPWSHPRFGSENQLRTEALVDSYGCGAVGKPKHLGRINLRWVAAMKLIEAGLARESIYVDTIDTYKDERFWSHRASQNPVHPKWGEGGRNLALVGNVS